MSIITNEYFKEYRRKLGFNNQNDLKVFFAGKNITPNIDYDYIDQFNIRLTEILTKINDTVVNRNPDISEFCNRNIDTIYTRLREADIIPRLNNQGRRPEEVYYSWMRGFVISNYFLGSLGQIFGAEISNIRLIGDDDIQNIDNFKRTPKADVEIALPTGESIRIEIQSGFQGINDIKQHKVLEARRIKSEQNISTFVIHFDLFNGQAAFVKADDIEENNINWITRQQMEGQTVFNIDQNYFIWKLTEQPPTYEQII